MTRNLQRIGGKALVALMATMMLLSVFAGPAAATGTVTAAEDTVSADEFVDGDSFTVSDSETTIEFGDDATDANTGDRIVAQIDSGVAGEGDLEINDALAEADGNDDLSEVDAEVVDGDRTGGVDNVFTGTDDTVIITLTDEGLDGTNIEGDTIDLTLEYTLEPQVAEEADGAYQTGSDVITVTDVSSGLQSLDGELEEPVTNLDITPGEPDALTGLDGTAQVDFGATNEEFTVGVQDQFENQITGDNVRGDLGDAGYESVSDISFDLDSQPNEEVTFSTDSEEIDLAAGTPDTAITIGDDGDDIDFAETVGNYTLTVDQADVESDSQRVDIEPDAVVVEFADDSFTADDGSTTVDVNVTDGDETLLDIAEVEADFELGVDNDDGQTANVTIDGTEYELGDDDTVTLTITESFNADNENTIAFETREAVSNQYTLTTTLQQEGSDSGSDTVDVDAGDAFGLDLDVNNDIQLNNAEADVVGTEVTVVDEFDNEVESDQYSNSDTEVEVEFTSPTGDFDDTVETTVDGVSDGDVVDIGNNDEDITAAVGTFDLSVTQVNDRLEDGSDDVTLTIYPNEVDFEVDETGEIDAGETNQLNIDLLDAQDQSVVDEVDQFDVDISLVTENLQADADLEENDALSVGIDDVGLLNESGAQQTVTVTVEEPESRTFDFNSTAAGQFELDAEVDTDDGASTDSSVTSEFDVEPLAITELDVEIDETFIGTIENEGGPADIDVTVEDEFGNAAGYDDSSSTAGTTTVNITAADDAEIFFDSFSEGDYEGSDPQSADRVVTAQVDDGDITGDDRDRTGDATVFADNDNADDAVTTDVDVVHEAFNLDEGFQRLSVPQPAEVHDENIGHFTTWNATAENYDSDEITVTGDIVGTSELHSGVYADADEDARVGYDFVTDDSVSTGQESLDAGWNFIGTNFDISNEDGTDLKTHHLEEDLRTVDEIDADASASEVVYDGGLRNILNVTDEEAETADLVDGIDYRGEEAGEYGTYWVYVEDPENLDSADRQLLGPNYEPEERDNIDS